MRLVVVVLAAALGACGEDHATAPDAGPAGDGMSGPGSCWPAIEHRSHGTAILGTGRDAFEVMPEVLPIEWGAQDGYMMIAHVRMTGFDPGNPDDVFDPRNPRTRIRAFFEDPFIPGGAHPAGMQNPALSVAAFCAFRHGYRDAGDGTYEMSTGVPIIFDTCWRSDNLIGRRIRLELEILDDSGAYARDVRIVTAAAPTSYHPEESGSPGCQHRYVPDTALQRP